MCMSQSIDFGYVICCADSVGSATRQLKQYDVTHSTLNVHVMGMSAYNERSRLSHSTLFSCLSKIDLNLIL